MKLCTCNNCGNIYEDMNPSDESIEYPLIEGIKELPTIKLEDGDTGYGCPECKTDGYLQDNINELAGGEAKKLFDILDNIGKAGYLIEDFNIEFK